MSEKKNQLNKFLKKQNQNKAKLNFKFILASYDELQMFHKILTCKCSLIPELFRKCPCNSALVPMSCFLYKLQYRHNLNLLSHPGHKMSNITIMHPRFQTTHSQIHKLFLYQPTSTTNTRQLHSIIHALLSQCGYSDTSLPPG